MKLAGIFRALSAFLLCVPAALSQQANRVWDENLNGWYMYVGDHPLGDSRWGLHLEGQWRRHDAISKAQQLLLRPGVNYEVNPNLMLTAGYGFVDTHRYGGIPITERFSEHRAFQQVALRHTSGKVRFLHRYRLEQRFLGEISRRGDLREVTRWRHENRFRYMLRFAVPFRGTSIQKGTWYAALYDEVYVNFGRNVGANIFDQNRAYGAIGYSTGRLGNVEAGYMNQVIQRRNGVVFEANHTLQLGFFSTLPLGRRDR
jgi:hypothetical protein